MAINLSGSKTTCVVPSCQLSTIDIPPVSSDITAYLNSLKFLAARSPGWLFPSHGPPSPESALLATRLHRTERELKIKVLWDPGERDPLRIAEQAYEPEAPLRLARVQVEAQLRRLRLEPLSRSGIETDPD